MEKVIRQTILRRNQLVKKSRKADLGALRKEWRDYNRQQLMNQNLMQGFIRGEQNSRREDWLCGPLAPNRDAGEIKGRYGSVPSYLREGGSVPARFREGPKGKGSDIRGSEDKRIFPDGEWSGQGIQGNIVVGDRVAVINGRPGVKGMVGEVTSVEHAQRQVRIKDVNKVDLQAAPHAPGAAGQILPAEVGIRMSDIRLVMPMQDEERGIHRDYIINEVRGGAPYYQRESGTNLPRHTRYIVGLDYETPWPAETTERQYTRDDDTTRIDVEYQTYIPSLTYKPLEDGVIDELRGKYSRTRRSHDDVEWMKRKVLEDARQSWLKLRKGAMMVTHPQVTNRQAKLTQQTRKLVEEAQKKDL